MRRYLKPTGTLGVLVEGHLAGLVDFDDCLTQLRGTNFRMSVEVERRARARLVDGTMGW